MAEGTNKDGTGHQEQGGSWNSNNDAGAAASKENCSEMRKTVAQRQDKTVAGNDTDYASSDEDSRDEEGDFLKQLQEEQRKELSRDQALSRLKDLCHVLGLSYKSKLDEFGDGEIEKDRVLSMLSILECTARKNFRRIQRTGKKLLLEWQDSDTTFKQMLKFYWVVVVLDASSSDDITQARFLSTDGVKRAKNQVKLLSNQRIQKARARYITQKKKLINLLSETHLTAADVGFDPTKQVGQDDYKKEKKYLKHIIRKVKLLSHRRKELVLRVEVLKSAVQSNAPIKEVEAMIEQVDKVTDGSESEVYDGQSLEVLLEDLFQKSRTYSTPPAEVIQEGGTSAPTSRTRSGKVHPITN